MSAAGKSAVAGVFGAARGDSPGRMPPLREGEWLNSRDAGHDQWMDLAPIHVRD